MSSEAIHHPPHPFARTICACRQCAISCEHLPGALAPGDVAQIAAHLGYGQDIDRFARECLHASEGGKIKMPDGRVIPLPSLVPASRPEGSCRFYEQGRCTIHAVSPYGCAYIDAHMPEHEFNRRANHLYAQVLKDQQEHGEYSRLIALLRAEGKTAPPLESRRYRLEKAIRREKGRIS